MPVLDKKLLLQDIEKKLNEYIPANTVRRILADAGEVMQNYQVIANPPDGGGPSDESTQLIRLYLDAKTIEGKSERTIARYEYILTRLYRDTGTPIRKMTVFHLRQYMMAEKERGISMNTIRGYVRVWSPFFTWLRAEGLTDSDPTANLGAVKARAEEEEPFTNEEIQLIKEACENDLERAAVHFLLATGCRISEMCSVNRNDIDWSGMKLPVVGKGDKRRTVYLDDVTVLMLRRYLKTREDIDPALFYSKSGTRFTPSGVQQMLKRVENRAGVPGVHPHRFRHTLATNLVDRGMSVQEVAAILGHAKLDTTMTYVMVKERNVENSYRKFASM